MLSCHVSNEILLLCILAIAGNKMIKKVYLLTLVYKSMENFALNLMRSYLTEASNHGGSESCTLNS